MCLKYHWQVYFIVSGPAFSEMKRRYIPGKIRGDRKVPPCVGKEHSHIGLGFIVRNGLACDVKKFRACVSWEMIFRMFCLWKTLDCSLRIYLLGWCLYFRRNITVFKDYFLLECDAVWPGRYWSTFVSDLLPQSDVCNMDVPTVTSKKTVMLIVHKPS